MKYFSKVNNESIFWFVSAGELHLSAKIIWQTYTSGNPTIEAYSDQLRLHLKSALPRTFALNAGLSLELGLKACIVQRCRILTEKQYIHDLIKLQSWAGIILSEHQQKQLKVLTEFISWAGKYPVGKNVNSFEELMNRLEELGIENPRNLDTFPISWDQYNDIWQKINYHFIGIGGGGAVLEDGSWKSDFKQGPTWKIIKRTQEGQSTSIREVQRNMTAAEAFILAEKLNDERVKKKGVFFEWYETSKM